MKIEQIQLVLELSREGTISKAAQNLFMAQPNASKALYTLENELGYSIINRTPNGVTFTDKGRQFLQYAHTVQRSIESMKVLKDVDTGIRFSLAAYEYPFVERSFHRFCENGLNYTESLRCELKMIGTVNEGVKLLSNCSIDMAVVVCRTESYGQFEKAFHQHGLHDICLGHTALYITLSEKHPIAKQKNINLDAFKAYPCITNAGITKDYLPPEVECLLQGVCTHIVMGPSQARLAMLKNNHYFAITTPYTKKTLAENGLINYTIPNTERHIIALFREEDKDKRDIYTYLSMLHQEFRVWQHDEL